MKKTKILYWIMTILFAFFMLGSAIPDILSSPVAVKGFTEMGYPVYLLPFLGIAKLLGCIVILVPGFPRIKEWAYAGLMFDIIGAVYSIIALGSPVMNWLPLFIIIALGILSYIFYHEKLKGNTLQIQNT